RLSAGRPRRRGRPRGGGAAPDGAAAPGPPRDAARHDGERGRGGARRPEPCQRPAAPGSDTDRAAGMLLAAERPVIYAGGGVHLSGCHDVLAAVAEYLQAGVVQSAEGKGAVGDASDLSLGAALWRESALRRHFEAADVILVVGSRLALAAPRPEQQVIQVDVDAGEIGKNHAKTFGLVG